MLLQGENAKTKLPPLRAMMARRFTLFLGMSIAFGQSPVQPWKVR
jgi:hypothetical protein